MRIPSEPYDTIIVLGARVHMDGGLSDALRQRLTLAQDLYAQRPVPIICCGAQGRDEPRAEGDVMREWFIRQGVPDAMVISENRSYDTLENIANAKSIMAERDLTFALVVTSDYHVRRALAICRRYHVGAVGMGSASKRRFWLKNHAREILAWVKYYMRL